MTTKLPFYRQAAWILLPLWAATTTAAADEPFMARVTSDQVLVRSGAGSNFYPTGYLDTDAEVEVYEATSDGWLAIRPPEGSFSLVHVSAVVTQQGEEVALVKAGETPSYIGSQLNSQHHLVQVKLDEEEPVQVLGLLELRDPESGKKKAWYKIAPPAGEFRWIHRQFVERTDLPPLELVDLTTDPEVALTGAEEAVEPQEQKPEPPDWRKRTGPPRVASLAPPPQGDYAKSVQSEIISGKSMEEGLLEELSQLDIDPLALVEVRLTKEVVKPVEDWDLGPLESSARHLINAGSSPLERGKARLLQEKIQSFARLQERKLALADALAAGSEPGPPAAEVGAVGDIGPTRIPSIQENWDEETELEVSPEGAETGTSDRPEPRYDGRGWLMPVVTRAAQARKNERYVPPFALTDKDGNVIQFVSPTPGLNLRRFTRQEVGIYGQVSPLDQYTKPHLTAHRVVVLRRHE